MLDVLTRAVITTTSNGLTIHSAPTRYVGWVLAFAVLLPLSWLCWRRKVGGTLAPGIFFACFTIPLIVVPGIALEHIDVSPSGLFISTGFWFSPTHRMIQFDGLSTLEERAERVAQRRAERRDLVWIFQFHSGKSARLKLPDLLAANREPVLEFLRKQGCVVQPSQEAP